jgi:RES domain-containing protein
MSAAGIGVFYGALDMATAKAETMANFEPGDGRVLTGATWTNTRPLRVLDLSRLPEIPSFYAQVRYERDHLLFLSQFVESITQPVQHDGREHTEYVPSQIVTEYFRHRYNISFRIKRASMESSTQVPSGLADGPLLFSLLRRTSIPRLMNGFRRSVIQS